MKEELIAPCGMNCGLCSSYLAEKNQLKEKGVKMPYCLGCRPRGKQCAFLKKRCDLLMKNKVKYCFECKDFPCQNLQKLDKRYQENYRMSMIQNLKDIKSKGFKKFSKEQKERWACPQCGQLICCHNGLCFKCDFDKLKRKRKKYQW